MCVQCAMLCVCSQSCQRKFSAKGCHYDQMPNTSSSELAYIEFLEDLALSMPVPSQLACTCRQTHPATIFYQRPVGIRSRNIDNGRQVENLKRSKPISTSFFYIHHFQPSAKVHNTLRSYAFHVASRRDTRLRRIVN